MRVAQSTLIETPVKTLHDGGDEYTHYLYWQLPFTEMPLETLLPDVGTPSPRKEEYTNFLYWQLPLTELPLDENLLNVIDLPLAGASEGFRTGEKDVGFDPPIGQQMAVKLTKDDDIEDQIEQVMAQDPPGRNVDIDDVLNDEAAVWTSPSPKRTAVDEMKALLAEYKAQADDLVTKTAELHSVQKRLTSLQIASVLQEKRAPLPPTPGGTQTGSQALNSNAVVWVSLPSEVLGRIIWFLQICELGVAARPCRDWARCVRSKERWRQMCLSDWGLQEGGSRKAYRDWLKRWNELQKVLRDLKASGHPSGIYGVTLRKQVAGALGTFTELGTAAGSHGACGRYPALLHKLVLETEALKTLLGLLDEESPYMLQLVICCLSNLAGFGEDKRIFHNEVVRRGAFFRALLEGEDLDLVECTARLLLNAHGSENPLLTTILKSSATIGGPWEGEMVYARGGERHAQFWLHLGPGAAAESKMGEASQRSGRIRAGDMAEYWRDFGFLARSDFDSAADLSVYVDELIRQRRVNGSVVSSPSNKDAGASRAPNRNLPLEKDLKNSQQPAAPSSINGIGWDEQNGEFEVSGEVLDPTAPGRGHLVKLQLQYRENSTVIEFLAFPARLCNPDGGNGTSVDALYGVWNTTTARHRHLFVLKRPHGQTSSGL